MNQKLEAVLVISIYISSLNGLIAASGIGDDGMFTSTIDLKRLVSTEAEIVKALKDYVQVEEDRIIKIKQYIEAYEEIQNRAKNDVDKYVGNPLNSYLLIKRLTSDWKEVKNLMSSKVLEDDSFANLTDSFERPLKWPSEDDLSGAAIALTRLQDTYNLSPSDMSQGKLNGVNHGTTFSAHDCFELGRQHYNSGDYENTIIWMKQAMKRLDEEVLGKETIKRSDLLEYIAFSHYTNGNLKKALQYTNELISVDPGHPRAHGNKLYYETNLDDDDLSDTDSRKKGDDGSDEDTEPEFSVSERSLIDNSPNEQTIYKKLCRGEKTKFSVTDKDLKCSYYYGHHPVLKIAPFKQEELNLNPRIVMFYDVLSESETYAVKSIATPRFRRATVQNYKTGELETAQYRISKTAWIKREEDDAIENIYKRVGAVTGLNMETSEELQVSNYGIGGHYEPHFDFARREETNAFTSLGTGNRIATWLFYFNDVEQGGATVFPDLGRTFWPKKGTAVFWYNLYKNGEGDVRTRHAACPVLAGTKWVSNFWIHERGQEFTRPCSVNPSI